ncbi:HNH endonuclease signature motif containing protein [Rhizobium sp. RM]|uniref:HNH endonuclease n=1 Tax=Rhizobium sp. RM TaxID=2748079 RepID=UPI00110D5A97|nr:HNH endonuclease signature motif containing protein [Rhizobium sp. RM]NWJ27661.1 HNH endonuclease [Rhizobium sp. RM]TMV18928.1 HNH endonuclease [Rhizobium sp. Td3]
MLTLDLPKNDNDATLAQIVARPIWARYKKAWMEAYKSYGQHNGDPWKVTPHAFPKTRQKAQRKFYDTRKGYGELASLRSTEGIKCCPMCGSQNTGTLDHYLPRKHYPEFSILSWNLIPACPACNSSVKGDRHKGMLSPERFLHPYFDTLANQAIWTVKVLAPFAAPAFKAEPLPGFSPNETTIIDFHVKNILGDQFRLKMPTLFKGLPQRVRNMMRSLSVLDNHDTEMGLRLLLTDVIEANSPNCWEAALLRGVLSDSVAIDYVRGLANLCTLTPLAR